MNSKTEVPEEKTLDNILAVIREGYPFIKNRVERYGEDIFETRLLGQKVICMSGKEAAEVFYDSSRFKRKGAAPKRVQKTLFGVNAIQSMDGEAHRKRRQIFLNLMSRDEQNRLNEMVSQQLNSSIPKWQQEEEIVLFDEMNRILCKVICDWAGVPLMEPEINDRAKEFSDMVEAFGAVGPRHWQGRNARKNVEAWIRKVIENVRSGKLKAEEGTAVYEMAFYTEPKGTELDVQMAAEELINVLRPFVAIATYMTFAALALHDYPETKKQLQTGDDKALENFVQEVRRFYPFAPFLGARVKSDFVWNGCPFKKNMLVLLDVYGTNHDERIWDHPYEFRPNRFNDWSGNWYNFIPQGGGDPVDGHRCPGEWTTVEMMKTTTDFLTNQIDYDVPDQDFSFSLSKMPTLPKSGFVMSHIRKHSM